MMDPPTVLSVTSSNVTLNWPSWYSLHPGLEAPVVIIESYAIEKISNSSLTEDTEWTEIGRVPANKRNTSLGPYTFTADKLNYGLFYSFRLVIVVLNNNKLVSAEPGPPTAWIGFLCGNLFL
jgi:hypothetical protein